MIPTFVIHWVDPSAPLCSVTFSTHPEVPFSVPVDPLVPDSWVNSISEWYCSNLQEIDTTLVGASVLGQTFAVTQSVQD